MRATLRRLGAAMALLGSLCLSTAWAQTTRPAEGGLPPAVSRESVTGTEPEPNSEVRNLFGLRAAPLEGTIITDRPDFTESTEVVPYGHIQVESGYTFSYDREGSDRLRDHTAPEFLFRLGLWEDFELRVVWLGYSWNESLFETQTRQGRRVNREEWNQGAYDLSLGFKQHLWDQDGVRPAFGVIVEASMPSGSSITTSGDVDPAVRLLWSYDLSESWSLAGNLNFAALTEESHRFFQTAGSISLAKSWTDRLGTYFEYFGLYPNTHHTDCAHYLNGGFTILITDDLQLDFRSGFGLNEEAADFFSGVGISFRL